MRMTYDDVTVSRLQEDVAATLDDLGVKHQMECLTDDEYFSLDLYLPDYDVAVEVDGPTHFMETETHNTSSNTSSKVHEGDTAPDDERAGADVSVVASSSASCCARYRPTLSTELRDMFLRRRHRGLVTLPWFELREVAESDDDGYGDGDDEGEGGEASKEERRRRYVADKLRAAGVTI